MPDHRPPNIVKYSLPVPLFSFSNFSALSFLLLAVVAVVLRTYQDSELHKLLRRDGRLRETLEFVRVPHRTTICRRLKTQVPEAESQIAALGQQLLTEVERGEDESEISAVDGRMYEADSPLPRVPYSGKSCLRQSGGAGAYHILRSIRNAWLRRFIACLADGHPAPARCTRLPS